MGIRKIGKIIGFLILSVASITSWAQDVIGSIRMEIIEDSLVCNSYSKSFPISFILRNESKDKVLVYGLKKGGPSPAGFPLSNTCSLKNIGTGIAFAIYKNDGKQIFPTVKIVDRNGSKPVTRDVLDSALQVMHGDFLKSRIEIIGKEERLFTKEIPLNNYNLKKGKYYFQMVYYSGNNTARKLNLNNESKGGKLFQGCTVSERIELIVN